MTFRGLKLLGSLVSHSSFIINPFMKRTPVYKKSWVLFEKNVLKNMISAVIPRLWKKSIFSTKFSWCLAHLCPKPPALCPSFYSLHYVHFYPRLSFVSTSSCHWVWVSAMWLTSVICLQLRKGRNSVFSLLCNSPEPSSVFCVTMIHPAKAADRVISPMYQKISLLRRVKDPKRILTYMLVLEQK